MTSICAKVSDEFSELAKVGTSEEISRGRIKHGGTCKSTKGGTSPVGATIEEDGIFLTTTEALEVAGAIELDGEFVLES